MNIAIAGRHGMDHHVADGSRIGQFPARRGVQISREFRAIGKISRFQRTPHIETLICTTLNVSVVEVEFGVLLKSKDVDENFGVSDHVNFRH